MKSQIFKISSLALISISLAFGQTKTAKIFQDYLKNPKESLLQDFSYAGNIVENQIINKKIQKVLKVTDFGILPNTNQDLTYKIQNLIDSVGAKGGGVLFFPKGKYLVNMDTTKIQFISIDYNNIIIRGEGSSKEGTIIFSGSQTTQEELNPWLSPAIFRTGLKLQSTRKFWGAEMKNRKPVFRKSASMADPGSDGTIQIATITSTVTKNAAKLSKLISVNSSKDFKARDFILLVMYNTTDESNLLKEMLGYDSFTPDLDVAIQAGFQRAPSFQWLIQIDKVIDEKTIQLIQPLRMNIDLKYEPAIAKVEMLKNIGIENLRMESAWDANYLHHGGNISSPKVSKRMDYGWNAINFCRVANSWIQNVVIDNYTNPLYLQDSRNNTLQNITFTGIEGHSGIKAYAHASDNLIQNIEFKQAFTHGLSLEGNAYGNVFRQIKYTPNDKIKYPYINFDFHGFASSSYAPPAWNLFENIQGFHTIDGGGAPTHFPHTAKGNIWWNILVDDEVISPLEIFHHWIWKGKPNMPPQYQAYPGSILVGYGNAKTQFTIENQVEDLSNPFIYTENFNKPQVLPISIYEEQLKLRNQVKTKK